MFKFPQTQDEELARLIELQSVQNTAASDNTKLPEVVDPIEAEVTKQYNAPAPFDEQAEIAKQLTQSNITAADSIMPPVISSGIEEENSLMGLPGQAKFSRGIVSPQASLMEQPKLDRSNLTPMSPAQNQNAANMIAGEVGKNMVPDDSASKIAKQTPDSKPLPGSEIEAQQTKEPDWEALIRAGQEKDAMSRLIKGLERGTRELVGGLTLTNPDVSNLVSQETNEADRARKMMADANKYKLDKQEAADNRELRKSQIEMNRVSKDAYAKQVDAQAKQVEKNALNKAEELKIDAAKKMADAKNAEEQTKIEADYKKFLMNKGWSELAAQKKASEDLHAYHMASIENKGDALQLRKDAADQKRLTGYAAGFGPAPGANPDPKQVLEHAKKAATINTIKGTYKMLSDLVAREGNNILIPKSVANGRANQLTTELLMQVKDKYGLGVLQKLDVDQVVKALGDPTGASSMVLGQFKDKVKQSRAVLDNELKAVGDTYRIVPLQSQANSAGSNSLNSPEMVKVVKLDDSGNPVGNPKPMTAEQAAKYLAEPKKYKQVN